MENNHIWLQLFADGDAAAPGVTDAAAGHPQTPDLPAEACREGEQAVGADREEQAADTAPSMTWEQIKADPVYRQKLQEMVRARLKNVKQAQQTLEKLSPVLRTLSRAYGLTEENTDYDALVQAVAADGRFAQGPRADLQEQARQFAAQVPEFDLEKELEDPTFARLTAPQVGVSLEDAYYLVHRKQLQADAAAQTAMQIANAIRSGSMRPEENGTAAYSPTVTTFDYRSASREQRNALKRQIRMAAARGEKVYP